VIPDERFTLRWDHVEQPRPEWDRDHDLASAMTCRHGGRPVGWLVGSATARGHTWIYALVLRGSTFDALMPMRRELAEQLLRSHGVLPPR